jgi:hypothetical protein
MTIGSVLFILVAANCFLLDTLENELQNIRINLRSAAVSSHNCTEVLIRGTGSNFKAFVLQD